MSIQTHDYVRCESCGYKVDSDELSQIMTDSYDGDALQGSDYISCPNCDEEIKFEVEVTSCTYYVDIKQNLTGIVKQLEILDKVIYWLDAYACNFDLRWLKNYKEYWKDYLETLKEADK